MIRLRGEKTAFATSRWLEINNSTDKKKSKSMKKGRVACLFISVCWQSEVQFAACTYARHFPVKPDSDVSSKKEIHGTQRKQQLACFLIESQLWVNKAAGQRRCCETAEEALRRRRCRRRRFVGPDETEPLEPSDKTHRVPAERCVFQPERQ